MDKFAWVNLLYDFYGRLLTERQQKIMELYYEQDLSLGEIAAEINISRQAVYDAIKRAGATLENYEEKLGFAAQTLSDRRRFQKALNHKKFTMRRREDNSCD